MKEIKFRQAIFKDGKFTHWHYWGYIGPHQSFVAPIEISQQSSPPTYELKENQQCSGWHSGVLGVNKEVYEGDLLRNEHIKPEYLPYIVKFGKHMDIAEAGCTRHTNLGFYIEDATGGQVGFLNEELLSEWNQFKVVGSNHETPELLPKEQNSKHSSQNGTN